MNVQNIITIADAAIEGIKAFKNYLVSNTPSSAEIPCIETINNEASKGGLLPFPPESRPVAKPECKPRKPRRWRGGWLEIAIAYSLIRLLYDKETYTNVLPFSTANEFKRWLSTRGVKLGYSISNTKKHSCSIISPYDVVRLYKTFGGWLHPNSQGLKDYDLSTVKPL